MIFCFAFKFAVYNNNDKLVCGLVSWVYFCMSVFTGICGKYGKSDNFLNW